jgi:hypothetical protein
MGLQMATQDFEIHKQCEQLIYKFLKVLEGEQAKTADLFAEDGRAFNLVGRDQIREHFGDIEKVDNNVNVVLCNNLVIDIEDEDHATATHYCTHYVSDPEPEDLKDPTGNHVKGELDTARTITRWSWEFRRVGDEWLISKLNSPLPALFRKDVIDELRSGRYS